eukprot:107142-Amphidinium_carterae.2
MYYRSRIVEGADVAKLSWVGRCFDLTSAHRQLGVADSSAFCSVISVWCPLVEKPVLFELHALRALPFVAISAVYCFNRVALAIRLYVCSECWCATIMMTTLG